MTNPIQAQTGIRLSDGVKLGGHGYGYGYRSPLGKWGVIRRPDRAPGTT
jgi:hypothetical protein